MVERFEWAPQGHAIQLRVYAEDVLKDFAGQGGVLTEYPFLPRSETPWRQCESGDMDLQVHTVF